VDQDAPPGSRDPGGSAGSVWRRALSVSVATGAYGVSFGALAVAAGLTTAQSCVLSLLMFTGGSQFAFIGVAASGGAGAAAVATSTLLGARNGLYGLQLAPLLALPGRHRALAAQLTIDESTAVATAQAASTPDRRDLVRLGFWATGGGVFLGWNLATLAGAILGDQLGDPRRYGLDAAAPAAFLALLWPRLAGRTPALVAGLAAAAALAGVGVLPAGLPVLLSALVATGAGLRGPRTARPAGPGNRS